MNNIDFSIPFPEPYRINWSTYLQGEALIEALKDNPDAMAALKVGIKAGFDQAKAAGVPTEAERIDEIADNIIRRLNATPRVDDPPPHTDADAPHEGPEFCGDCPCARAAFVDGVVAAAEVMGVDPDEVFNKLDDDDPDAA